LIIIISQSLWQDQPYVKLPQPRLQYKGELVQDGKTEKLCKLISRIHPHIKELLVVGCGRGIEAAILAQVLDAKVTGIDVLDDFDPEASTLADLATGDATALAFDDASFDFVYSYHALEHIDRPKRALAEIARVLKPDGGYWIGTPNRSRLIGYIGSKSASTAEKIRWNLTDWRARLTGRFRNEYGAHAGFTRRELGALLREALAEPRDESLSYYELIYPAHSRTLAMLSKTGLDNILYPSVYFSGRGQ